MRQGPRLRSLENGRPSSFLHTSLRQPLQSYPGRPPPAPARIYAGPTHVPVRYVALVAGSVPQTSMHVRPCTRLYTPARDAQNPPSRGKPRHHTVNTKRHTLVTHNMNTHQRLAQQNSPQTRPTRHAVHHTSTRKNGATRQCTRHCPALGRATSTTPCILSPHHPLPLNGCQSAYTTTSHEESHADPRDPCCRHRRISDSAAHGRSRADRRRSRSS